jgi:nucleoid DNA-binding protein
MKLTRISLTEDFAQKFFLPYRAARSVVNEILNHLIETLGTTTKCKITGFGSFIVHKKKSRKGRNPKTGAFAEISERSSITFRPSRKLKERINNSNILKNHKKENISEFLEIKKTKIKKVPFVKDDSIKRKIKHSKEESQPHLHINSKNLDIEPTKKISKMSSDKHLVSSQYPTSDHVIISEKIKEEHEFFFRPIPYKKKSKILNEASLRTEHTIKKNHHVILPQQESSHLKKSLSVYPKQPLSKKSSFLLHKSPKNFSPSTR